MSILLIFIVIAVLSYLLGSLNFGIILSKAMGDDVRKKGSGNAGTTNMLRNYGKGLAALTIIGDMVKVAIAILISVFICKKLGVINNSQSFPMEMLVKCFSGFFCVLGHIFPVFFGFKGGKGVATSGGMVFMIDWRIGLILLAIFIIVVVITKYVSLGSLIMAALYPALILAFHQNLTITSISLIFTAIVFIAHRENIKKLMNHNENKISFKKKESE